MYFVSILKEIGHIINGTALYIIELYVCNPVIMLGSYWLITHVDNTGIIVRGVSTAAAITEMRLGICFLDKKFCAFYKHDGNGWLYFISYMKKRKMCKQKLQRVLYEIDVDD